MKQKRFSINRKDGEMIKLVEKTDQKILAIWAIDNTKRVLHLFDEKYPKDLRPQKALETLQNWIDTGVFKMAVIRKASLGAHAAARETEEDNPARSVARACGQAVATVHVSRHSYGSAIYAQQAIYRASKPSRADSNVKKERDRQYQHLLELRKSFRLK